LETRLLHRTLGADPLRGFGRRFLFRRWEERVALDATASSGFPPASVWFPHQIAQTKQCAIPLLFENRITTIAVCEFPICHIVTSSYDTKLGAEPENSSRSETRQGFLGVVVIPRHG